MDLIALASIISTLTCVCLKAVASLNAIRPHYKNEEHIINSIHSECTAISVSLTKIQLCVLQDSTPPDQTQLNDIFDVIITGCRVLFACIEQDLDRLSTEAPVNKSWKPWGPSKNKTVEWDQKHMQGCLADVRMQQGALILLTELMLIKDPEQFQVKTTNSSSTLQQQILVTHNMRAANTGLDVPSSVYIQSFRRRQPAKPVLATTYDQSFAFDNILVNSESYRRSIGIPPSAASRSQPSRPLPGPSNDMDAKDEKEDLARKQASETNSPDDDELPEYTPYPDERFHPEPANEYIPSPKAVFQSYGVANTSTPNPISSERIPPTHVPNGSESLPLTATPSNINYTLPINKDQHVLVQLQNLNPSPIQFHVKTTAPTRYCVRPNRGTIAAGQSIVVDFIAVEWSESTTRPERADRFRVESMVVKLGESFEWARDAERRAGEVQMMKIRVGLEGEP